jgi:hypothetical protein
LTKLKPAAAAAGAEDTGVDAGAGTGGGACLGAGGVAAAARPAQPIKATRVIRDTLNWNFSTVHLLTFMSAAPANNSPL